MAAQRQLRDLPGLATVGAEIHAIAASLYPINRSLTGDGVRKTLRLLQKIAPLEVHEVPSGTEVLDWTVPPEWNVREAHIADHGGNRIVDLRDHALHVVGYSTPVDATMTLDELRPHLHTLPDQPDLIPYRTSYYREAWGFCLSQRQLAAMRPGSYRVVIDSSLNPGGSMSYGELLVEGETADEVLLTAHVCHPSLANDNCSGLALLAWLARHLGQVRLRHSYRILMAPGTIGAIAWLAANRDRTPRIKHGLVISNVGDGGGPNYKRSRRGNAAIDRAAEIVLCRAPTARILDFSPYGYDERQFCSPGFDLPVGALQRSRWGQFPEYHTSADNLEFIRPEHLGSSLGMIVDMLDVLERDRLVRGTMPFGEPQLGRRGLYDGPDGRPLPEPARMAILWVLNLADGRHTLADMAERADLPFHMIAGAAEQLTAAKLLIDANDQPTD